MAFCHRRAGTLNWKPFWRELYGHFALHCACWRLDLFDMDIFFFMHPAPRQVYPSGLSIPQVDPRPPPKKKNKKKLVQEASPNVSRWPVLKKKHWSKRLCPTFHDGQYKKKNFCAALMHLELRSAAWRLPCAGCGAAVALQSCCALMAAWADAASDAARR